MGYYINPVNMTKERWLQKNGVYVGTLPPEEVPVGYVPVCWVSNGAFTASAVAYRKEELLEFNRSDDNRPKSWFLVKIDEELYKVCQECRGMIEWPTE